MCMSYKRSCLQLYVLLDMTVGFSKIRYNVKEAEGIVSICVIILSHKLALRDFTVAIIPEKGKLYGSVHS